MVVCFVDIGGIVDHECLSFLSINQCRYQGYLVPFRGFVPDVRNLPH